MNIDLPTLMLAGSFVTAISGAFLFFAWLQSPHTNSTLWWASGDFALAAAVPLIATHNIVFGVPSTIMGILLLNISPALLWAAARSSNGREPHFSGVIAGAFVWLIAFAMPVIRDSLSTQMTLNLAVIAFYLFATANEFWRGRAERLQSRWPLIVLLFLHGLFFLFGTLLAAAGRMPIDGSLTPSSWVGLVHFETLAFVVGTAIFTAAMARERAELRYMAAARIDPLTGVANRRAFIEEAEELVKTATKEKRPLSLIMFDLDRFKSINDSFGHATGDTVLKRFAEIARGSLRTTDILGRPGGEEFAVLLPNSNAAAAMAVAERIRVAFAAVCCEMDNRLSNATVSAGVTTARRTSTFDTMMATADEALYRAKAEGRNRVTFADRGEVVALAQAGVESDAA
jgi:diguanylate cyclase (GGDEF)-like protein